jgi:molecular chaperone GrpE
VHIIPPHGREERLADAEPPDDEGRSPAGEPEGEAAGTGGTPEAGLAPAAVTPAPSSAPGESPPASPLEQRARLAEDRLAEVLAAYRKLKVENEEVRERQSRNLERRFEQRRERLLLKFIDVLDNLDRALEATQTSYAGQPLLEGMILVRTQLLQTLQDEGLDRIPVLGLAFDPAVSESVGTAPVKDSEQHHIVVKELLRGYRINGRIARPSRVLIGVFEGAQEPLTTPSDAHGEAAAVDPQAEPAAAAPVAPADADPSTAETARLSAPSLPPPIPPRPSTQPRRKGRG